MEKNKEDIEEKKLIDSVERGEWKTVDDFSELKKEIVRAAKETALKDFRINVRISKRDVEELKTLAMQEGIPYQTLITSILHKYVSGRLIDSSKSKTT
jgi:predicted DNA binding CopG/RHH family protein